MTAQLLPYFILQFRDNNGFPLASGKLFSYQAGTSTPLVTYTNEGAGTPNTNPVILDSTGSASIWIRSGAYKFILQDSLGNVIRTVDNVSYINPGSITASMLGDDIAGIALDQNGVGALDVQVDNTTIQVVGNKLTVKNGALTPDILTAASKQEILFRKVRDLNNNGSIQTIPQYEWTSPIPFLGLGTPPATPTVTKWSPDGEFMASGSSSGAFLCVYQLDRTNGALNNIGQPVDQPTSTVNDLCWSPCGDFLVCALDATPWIAIYRRYGSTFTQLPVPATLPQGSPSVTANSHAIFCRFSPNSDYLGVSANFINSSSGLHLKAFFIYERGDDSSYPITGTAAVTIVVPDIGSGVGGAGTYTDSAPLTGIDTPVNPGETFTEFTTAAGLSTFQPVNMGSDFVFAFSPDSSYLIFNSQSNLAGSLDSFFRAAGEWTGFTGPVLPTGANALDVGFSPDGNILSVAIDITPFIVNYRIQGGTFTQLPNPAPLPTAANSVSWSANSEYLAIDLGVSPYLFLYKVANTDTAAPSFTKQDDLGVFPSGPGRWDWYPTKQFISSDAFLVYQTSSTLFKNALLWSREAPNV